MTARKEERWTKSTNMPLSRTPFDTEGISFRYATLLSEVNVKIDFVW